MILTLEVRGEQAAQLGAGRRKVFASIGGTIGRLPDNDWVFPDPYVSGRHALIRYVNGRFFVEDTSTNGVFVNSPESRVTKTQAHQLRHGDTLFIDAYEIAVSIEKDQTAESKAQDPFAGLQSRKPAAPAVKPAPAVPAAPPASHDQECVDRSCETQWFGLGEIQLPELPESQAGPKVVAVRASEEATASQWSATESATPAPIPAPDPARETQDREMAMHNAIRLAFEKMLAQFDPERLQVDFDRQMKKGSILGVPAKLRYWDQYREKYAELSRDADAAYRALFAAEFAKAYAEQLDRFKARSAKR